MNAIYTTCTYNHLARAFSLADSVRKYNPDALFLIGLIDDADEGIELPPGCVLIEAKNMRLPFFGEMCSRYETLELNSALKPYFANFILEDNAGIDKLIYLDSDILLYSSLEPTFAYLDVDAVLLTPHSFSSLASGAGFDDRNFLRSGIYNAGFFGVNRSEHAISFLRWWSGKLRSEGFFNSKKGMFAEQLWLNLVPLYFKDVRVLSALGYNVAYWNLHERKISRQGDNYVVNDTEPLFFFHFSGASPDCFERDSLSEFQTMYSFTGRPDVVPLFKEYIKSLSDHSFQRYSRYYTVNNTFRTRSRLLKAVMEFYKRVSRKLS